MFSSVPFCFVFYRDSPKARGRAFPRQAGQVSRRSHSRKGRCNSFEVMGIAKKIELPLSRLLHIAPLDRISCSSCKVWRIVLYSNMQRLMYKVWQCRMHRGTSEQGAYVLLYVISIFSLQPLVQRRVLLRARIVPRFNVCHFWC